MDTLQNWLIESSEDFQFILYFGLLFFLIIAEHLYYFRTIKRKKRWTANFTLTFLSILAMSVLPFSFLSAAELAFERQLGLFNNVDLPWELVAFCTFLLRGFISFFTHFLSHKIPLFWRIHRIHHLDTELDVSTNVRFHPFEFIINFLLGVPVILLFGFPVWVLMLYELFDIVVTLISHSNISFPPRVEKILKFIIVTPDLHRIHHSSYQPETDSNFSAVFPIWDLIFGTYKSKTKVPPKEMTLGLEEVRDERTNNILWLLLSPFKNLKNNP